MHPPVRMANLMSRKFGMHRKVCFVQGNTLQEIRYKLKTLLGVSDEDYQHCELYPIYGTGQGSGSSPGIWLVISSTLFDCHEQLGHGAQYDSPDRTETQKLNMIGFVDDSAGQVNDFAHETPLSPKDLL